MSPQAFDKCVADGGRMSTISVNKTQYMHVCYDKAGKSYHGEVKTKQRAKRRNFK